MIDAIGRLAGRLIVVLLFSVVGGCGGDGVSPDYSAFFELAENATCADLRNDLYAIDGRFVFWAREGSCTDQEFAYFLLASTPDTTFCGYFETIAGESRFCHPECEELFETILRNLDDPNLGLRRPHWAKKLEP